jgi:RNA polymerase sigma factor for flagellar operon FliA
VTRLTYTPDILSEREIAERVRLHMPLARKIAWQMHGRVRDLFEIEDLIQIGMTTLVEAAQRFQDTGEATFGTYAAVRVRGALVDHLRNHLSMTRTAVQRRNRIESAEASVRQRGEDPANVNIMATELGISLLEYRSWKDQIVPVTGRSLDEIYDDHSVWFADEGPNPETALLDDELRQKLVENLKKLGEREALVLQLYYVEDLNLEEISEVLSVTVGRVSQIKKAAITQLRRTMLEIE